MDRVRKDDTEDVNPSRALHDLSPRWRIAIGIVCWLVFITWAHVQRNGTDHEDARTLRVGYLPITCHLLCPVTQAHVRAGDPAFMPVRFSSWPEMIECIKGGRIDMAFILAPIAIALRAQGIPVRVVLLGHRDGTALVVKNSGNIHGIGDLGGRRVAIPIRFSNQHLALLDLLEKNGVDRETLTLTELPPPDMPSVLGSGAIDAYIVGEPYAAQAEAEGWGRVLVHMADAFPGFISSVLVVRDETIRERGGQVRSLIRAFLREASWIEEHRREAAGIGARAYGLPEPLLARVLTQSGRVSYSNLIPREEEFKAMADALVRRGLLVSPPDPADLVDTTWRTDP